MISNVSNVELINPPTTTVASGFCISEPVPVVNSIGIKLKIAMDAVISTGLNLSRLPLMMASRSSIPSSRNCDILETSTTPFKTATPNRTTNPTEAGTDKYNPEIYNEIIPPISANGKFEITSRANLIDLNVTNNKSRIKPTTTGPIINSLFIARC